MQTIQIRTTQNVVIEYQPASLGDRILANLLDLLIMVAYTATLFISISQLGWNPEYAGWIILMLPLVFYHLVSEIFMDGQTLGQRQTKIKVVRLDGAQPSLGNYLTRWLFRIVDVLSCWGAVAIVTIAVTGKGQRFGDMAAGTAVVSLRRRVDLSEMRLPTLEEDYEPIYPQAASLSDRDVAIIRETLHLYANSSHPDPAILELLTHKVKELLQITEPVSPLTFLRTILRDHTHLTAHA